MTQTLTDDVVAFFLDQNFDVAQKHERYVALSLEERRELFKRYPDLKKELVSFIASKHKKVVAPSSPVTVRKEMPAPQKAKKAKKLMRNTREIRLLKKRIQRKMAVFNELYNNCFEIGRYWEWMKDELVHSYSSLEMNMRLGRTDSPEERNKIISVYHAEMNAIGRSFEKCLEFALQSPDEPITEAFVKDLHRILLPTEPDRAGSYRQIKVRFANSQVVLPNWQKVPELIPEMLETNNKIKSKIERAFKIHFDLAAIHPFTDGNGRISRLVMNTVLMQNNMPPVLIDPAARKKYLEVLSQYSLKGDDTAYRVFMLNQLDKSLTKSVERLTYLPHLETRFEKSASFSKMQKAKGNSR